MNDVRSNADVDAQVEALTEEYIVSGDKALRDEILRLGGPEALAQADQYRQWLTDAEGFSLQPTAGAEAAKAKPAAEPKPGVVPVGNRAAGLSIRRDFPPKPAEAELAKEAPFFWNGTQPGAEATKEERAKGAGAEAAEGAWVARVG
jgi:hypothetical protein